MEEYLGVWGVWLDVGSLLGDLGPGGGGQNSEAFYSMDSSGRRWKRRNLGIKGPGKRTFEGGVQGLLGKETKRGFGSVKGLPEGDLQCGGLGVGGRGGVIKNRWAQGVVNFGPKTRRRGLGYVGRRGKMRDSKEDFGGVGAGGGAGLTALGGEKKKTRMERDEMKRKKKKTPEGESGGKLTCKKPKEKRKKGKAPKVNRGFKVWKKCGIFGLSV